jgi:hypothetical protein
MAAPSLDRQTILRAVQSWPAEEQMALVREILEQAPAPIVEEPRVAPNSASLAGLIANGKTPPTDEEVAQWLDERRAAKYGG